MIRNICRSDGRFDHFRWSTIADSTRNADSVTCSGPREDEMNFDEEPCPEGRKVTNKNRMRYSRQYVYWLTHESIAPQWNAFSEGFFCCLNRKALHLFSPEDLKQLVEGSNEVDVEKLRKAALYERYDAKEEIIEDFWKIINAFSQYRLRKLLQFVTASDRVPFGGIETVKITISQNGVGDEVSLL